MAHHTENTERLEIENGQIVRIVTATYKDFSLDVLKEYEDGTFYARNLEWSNMAGWLVTFPGEKVRYRYTNGSYIQELEDWYELRCDCNMWSQSQIPFDKTIFINACPELKYFFMKFNVNTSYKELLALVRQYKKYPNIETLIEKGLYSLALNTNLQRLSKPKLSIIINFIRDNEGFTKNTMLKDIQCCLKENVKYIDYGRYKYSAGDMELFNYLRRKRIDPNYYNDYICMCRNAGHNISDMYWKYPNDIFKAHDKVMDEVKNIENAKSKIRGGLLRQVTLNFKKLDSIIDGYRFFIPNSLEIINKQCEALHQCLLTKNYVDKMINQEQVLVFVWKDDLPVATAQVFYEKNTDQGQEKYDYLVGQFYADESKHKDRNGNDCLPPLEVQSAFKKWFSSVKIKRRKFTYTQKYYKGFTKMDGDAFVGFNNYHFKIGEVYDTLVNDDIILATGSACVSTNKVFHFCDNLREISRHYNPGNELYCEIQPLGPVVENDGALLSNKIKILRRLSSEEIKQLMAQ